MAPLAVIAEFQKLSHGSDTIGPKQFAHFLLTTQSELCSSSPSSSPDEIEKKALDLIRRFHDSRSGPPSHRRHFHNLLHHRRHLHEKLTDPQLDDSSLTLEEFTELLLSPELNPAMEISKQPTHDMALPLSHYYIYASHNSYLTGNQLTSKSSTGPIAAALQDGYRVIELDCWERHGKIMVLHGNTLTKAVPFSECLKVINQYAFVASPYPVIITIENHLHPDLQRLAAMLIKEVFGDALYIPREDERPPRQFASPEDLKHKIIISDSPPKDALRTQAAADPAAVEEVIPELLTPAPGPDDEISPPLSPTGHGYRAFTRKFHSLAVGTPNKEEIALPQEEKSWTTELRDLVYISCEKPSEMKDAPSNGQLVSGERSIMANVSEPQLRKFVETNPSSLIEYCKNNLGRMYPFGLRFDSSNADPFLAWSHGFQLAALNTQGYDRPCWIARAFFDSNGGCGYVKKPQFLLPGSKMTNEELGSMPPNLSLTIKILLGTDWHKKFDLFTKPDFFVTVAIHGIPADKAKKKTSTIYKSNRPNWENETFEFQIRVPDIAVLRLEVRENDRLRKDDFVGQACFPVREMKSGIRAVPLRSKEGGSLSSKLLCMINLKSC